MNDVSGMSALVGPKEVAISSIRFVKELYPRLKPLDDGSMQPIKFTYFDTDAKRLWSVMPFPPSGWSVEMTDFSINKRNITHGGFCGEFVMMTLNDWGIPQSAVWMISPFELQKRNNSYVYAIGTQSCSMVKIGRATDVRRRLADIQRMSPVPLEIIWKAPGDHKLETRLHRAFAHKRSYGEWFDFSDVNVVDVISAEAGQ